MGGWASSLLSAWLGKGGGRARGCGPVGLVAGKEWEWLGWHQVAAWPNSLVWQRPLSTIIHPPLSSVLSVPPRSPSSCCRRRWSRPRWLASCAAARGWPRAALGRSWGSGSPSMRPSGRPSCRPLTSQVGGRVGGGVGGRVGIRVAGWLAGGLAGWLAACDLRLPGQAGGLPPDAYHRQTDWCNVVWHDVVWCRHGL